jgi:hypothetical protein
MADLTGVLTGTSIEKGQDNVITLNKTLLNNLFSDAYFDDANNWKSIIVIYKTPEGQVNDMIFDAALGSPVGNFNPTDKSIDATWEVQAILIQDFDNGSLRLNRGDLTTADFDIVISGVSTTQSAFDPALGSQTGLTYSNNNRTVTTNQNNVLAACSTQVTLDANSKIFYSIEVGNLEAIYTRIGISFSNAAPTSGTFNNSAAIQLNSGASNRILYTLNNAGTGSGSQNVSATIPAIVTGDTVSIALDLSINKVYIRINGVWLGGEPNVSGGFDVLSANSGDWIGLDVYKTCVPQFSNSTGEDFTFPETPTNIPVGYELV